MTRHTSWVAPIIVGVTLAAIDCGRPPGAQWTANACVAMVGIYQRHVSPRLATVIRCRFVPSCSAFTVDALRRHGTVRGLGLAIGRVSRCRRSVAVGTADPVPAMDGPKQGRG